jgi:hypothetical protein
MKALALPSELDIQVEMLSSLPSTLSQLKEGGKARAILDIVKRQLFNYYKTTGVLIADYLLSTASGSALDGIGSVYGVSRYLGESDASYSSRISNNILSSATANSAAITNAINSVSGIMPVGSGTKKIDFAYGSGSFAIVPAARNGYVTDTQILDLYTAINAVVAAGIHFEVIKPTLIPITLKVSVDIVSSSKDLAKSIVMVALRNYIFSLNNGDSFDFYMMIREAENSVNDTLPGVSVRVTPIELKIDNKLVMYKVHTPEWYERYYLGGTDSIIVY